MAHRIDLAILTKHTDGPRPFGAQGYFLRELDHYADARGLRVAVLDYAPGSSIERMAAFDSLGVPLDGGISGRVFYDRLNGARNESAEFASARRSLEAQVPVFNAFDALELMSDKARIHDFLLPIGLRLPQTVRVSEYLKRPQSIEGLSRHVVLKPRTGSRGSGVAFVDRHQQSLLRDGRSLTASDMTALTDFLLQDDVGHRDMLEVRTLVQKRAGHMQAVGSYAKVPAAGALGNISLGAQARSLWEVPEFRGQVHPADIEDQAVAAATAVDDWTDGVVFEVGVDQAVTPDGFCWILELNGRPARFGFELVARDATSPAERERYTQWRRASVENVLDFVCELESR